MNPVCLSLLLFPLAAFGAAQAQDRADGWPPDRPNRVYVELLGNAGGGSVNVEREVAPQVSVRVGLGYMPGLSETTVDAVAAPVMVSFTPRGRRGVEIGVGAVLRHQTRGRLVFRGGEYVDQAARFTDTFLTATVGYRWTTERGTLFRVGVTPLYGRPEGNDDVAGGVPLIGVSVGGAF